MGCWGLELILAAEGAISRETPGRRAPRFHGLSMPFVSFDRPQMSHGDHRLEDDEELMSELLYCK